MDTSLFTKIAQFAPLIPEKFASQNFKRWQHQVKFWLTTLGLFLVISTNPEKTSSTPSTPTDESSTPSSSISKESDKIKEKELDEFCHSCILLGLSNQLYDLYRSTSSAHEVWNALNKTYGTEDKGSKRYSFAKFLNFKIEDNKSVLEQTLDLQSSVHEMKMRGLEINDTALVSTIIEKLPPSLG